MEEKEKYIDDYQEQYDVLIAEEEEKQKKKAFWIMFFCLFIILFSVLGATYSYIRVYVGTNRELNIDTDGDGIPDLNIDPDGDGICNVNCDNNGDKKPYLNVSYNKKHLSPLFNLDTDGDGVPDKNLINQDLDHDGICDLNCDTNNDGFPDKNVDMDGDGKPDINIDTDGDGVCNLYCDTNGDGVCDLYCDIKNENSCNLNCDTNGDGKCDLNCDTDGDGICDLYCDTNGDGVCDTKCETDPIVEVKKELHVYYRKEVIGIDVAPGWQDTLRFSVENKSDKTMIFDIDWVNVKNEFSVANTITYSIWKDGILLNNNLPVPKTNGKLLQGILIPANTTYVYEIEYKFNDLPDVDQTMDLGKTFKAQLEVKEENVKVIG